jgi:hypothetical protein
MSLFSRTSLALVVVIAIASIGAAAAGASDSGAQAARACSTTFRQGGVYVYSLSTKGVSCRTGKRVAKAFTKCRHKHGARGHCHHRVRHFRCSETRGQSSPAQYNSTVSCKRGHKRVKFGYTQNT